MDLENIIGELFIVGFQGTTIEPGSQIETDLAQRNLGGVILFDRCLANTTLPGNIESPNQLKQLTSAINALTATPPFIAVDQEGGLVQRLRQRNGFSASASAAEMGRSSDGIAFTEIQAQQTAKMLSQAGINTNFAPVVDLDINHENPVIGKLDRSFSDMPEIVIRHAEAWIRSHRKHSVISCLKHFPGHGSSTSDSHLGFVDISTTWNKHELIPYQELISKGLADMIMTGHLFNRLLDPAFPATLSKATITDLLRQKLGFDGLVLTDDIQMKAITSRYGFQEALCKSFAAGVDIIIIGNNLEYDPLIFNKAVGAVCQGVRQGLVAEGRLYNALERVRTVKQLFNGTANG